MTTTDILNRLKAATGPDRELDFDIAQIEGWTQHIDERDPVFKGRVSTWWAEPGEDWSTTSVPEIYTASIDASLALVERMLPGWMVENLCEWEADTLRSRGSWTCDLKRRNSGDYLGRGRGLAKCPNAATPALALLQALFTALEAKEKVEP